MHERFTSTFAGLRVFVVVLLAAMVCGCATHQHRAPISASPTISPEGLQSDLRLLVRVLEEVHPGVYRYNTPEQFAASVAKLESQFSRDATRREAFIALSEFTASLRCGHTFLNPANQSDEVTAEFFTPDACLPFNFRWIDGNMVVAKNLSGDSRLAPGTTVLRVDGMPAPKILARLLRVARADGANDAKRINLLEPMGRENFETFDAFYALEFPRRGETYALEIRAPGSKRTERINVGPITSAARRDPSLDVELAPDAPLWELEFLADGTAYLRMDSWVAYNTKWDWKGFLNSTFATLAEKKIANLVIDLRGNEGGSSVGDIILAHLIAQPVPASSFRSYVRYRELPADLSPALDTWDDEFRNWGSNAVGPLELSANETAMENGRTVIDPARATGFFQLTKWEESDPEFGYEVIRPAAPHFAGRVFVIVDASNSSATFQFATAAQSTGVATIVGQPTGGNLRGINGSAFFFLRLPASGLEIDIPIAASLPKPGAKLPADSGVAPDVFVPRSAESIAGGADAEMEAIREIIALTR